MQCHSFAPLAAAAALLAVLACNSPTDLTNEPTARAVDVGPSFANDKHLTPGTPGEANCKGQTIAFLAQAGKNGLTDPALGKIRGIGGLAKAAELSVQEIHAIVEEFCNPVVP